MLGGYGTRSWVWRVVGTEGERQSILVLCSIIVLYRGSACFETVDVGVHGEMLDVGALFRFF